jgi:hypothetical protein
MCSGAVLAAQERSSAEDPKEKQSVSQETARKDPERRTRVRLGGITVGAGYARFSGPYYPGYPYYGWPYSPFYSPAYGWLWYNPFFHPGIYTGFAREANKGEVRLRADDPKAEVYLDGAYAGPAAERKSMWLDPGAYNLEVRAENRAPYSRRIYVLTGKTLRIEASLPPQTEERKR